MSKAILVMDMPMGCNDCSMVEEYQDDYLCRVMDAFCKVDKSDYSGKPDWCPLVPAIGYIQPVGHMVSWEDDGDE